MKRLLMIVAAFLLMLPEIQAKPKAHVEVSFDVIIGRPKKECNGLWLCIKNWDIDVRIEPEMPKNNNHSIVLDEDGSLFLAIEMSKIRIQDYEKFKTLEGGILVLDSEESLPAHWLSKLGYSGSNTFKAGRYRVTKLGNYFMVKLN